MIALRATISTEILADELTLPHNAAHQRRADALNVEQINPYRALAACACYATPPATGTPGLLSVDKLHARPVAVTTRRTAVKEPEKYAPLAAAIPM